MTRPEQGDVWSYNYLWRWQHERGETEGRKTRPTAFVATVTAADGRTDLFILAITDKVIPFGHSTSQAPVFEQLPKPSSSIAVTMFSTLLFASTLPCGSKAN